MDLLPFESDDIDEETLGEPVAPDHRGRKRAALFGEAERPVVHELGVAAVDQPVDLLRHRRRRDAEAFDEPSTDRDDAFFLEFEDGLEVLLGRIVHLRHGATITLAGRGSFPVHQLALGHRECQHGLALV